MLWQRQAIFEFKGVKLSSSAECRIRTWKSQGTYSPSDWMHTHKLTELSRIKLKTWTQQPVPLMIEEAAHLTSLPSGFRTWLCRYSCLLLLISILLHRQPIFESIWAIENQVKNLNLTACPYGEWAFSPLDFTAVWLLHLALAIYMFVVNFDALAQASDPSLWSASIQPTWPYCNLAFAPGSGDTHICCC